MQKMTRERWLEEFVRRLRPLFKQVDAVLPEKIRVTCGWPSKAARARTKRRIGECWSCTASEDGHYEIFISPILADSLEVSAVLVHELVHAAVGVAAGHKGPFVKLMNRIGLVGKPTATEAGDELKEKLRKIVNSIGQYPHAAIQLNEEKGRPRAW